MSKENISLTYTYWKQFFDSKRFLGAKIEENRGWQNFVPTHFQKRYVIIFTVSENLFSKYLEFLVLIERPH